MITKKILAAGKFPTPHYFSNGPSLTDTKWPTNGVIIYRYVSRLLNINFFVLFCVLYWKESANKRYRNIVNNPISPNTVSQNDEIPHTAELDDTAILHVKIKITEIPHEKKAQYRNTVNLHVPLLNCSINCSMFNNKTFNGYSVSGDTTQHFGQLRLTKKSEQHNSAFGLDDFWVTWLVGETVDPASISHRT